MTKRKTKPELKLSVLQPILDRINEFDDSMKVGEDFSLLTICGDGSWNISGCNGNLVLSGDTLEELEKTANGEDSFVLDEEARERRKDFVKVYGNDGADDPVNHPRHYTYGKYEVIDILEEFFSDSPLAWQIGKYIFRYRHKGKPVDDLKKARWYLDRLIAKTEASDENRNS